MVFQRPTPIDDAMAFADALLGTPGVQLATLGPEWARFRQLCLDKQLSGNDLPGTWLAAATTHLGEHLVSFDRSFRKLMGRGKFTWLAAESGSSNPRPVSTQCRRSKFRIAGPKAALEQCKEKR